MPEYEYRVVPFMASGNSYDQRNADKVAAQLQAVIETNTGEGWEFYRIDQVQIRMNPGCMAAIVGVRSTYTALDQVTFRREQPGA